jgi:hypothetical protein
MELPILALLSLLLAFTQLSLLMERKDGAVKGRNSAQTSIYS